MNIKLEELYFVWNGGKGSGNHNPGQGRGVGKPSNRNNTYKKMVSSANLTEEEKRYKKYWEDYGGEYIVLAGSNPLDEGYEDEKYEDEKIEDGRTFEQARDYFDSMIRKRKFPEDTTVYRRLQFPTKSDLEKAIKNNFVWDAPQATSSTLNPKFLKDSKINPFKLVEDENCLILKINVKKGQSGLALDNSMEEIILPRYSEFKIKKEDEKIDGITTYVVDYVEHTTKENLNSLSFQVNGGPNSGNHNPGQGRGVGKPAKKSKKISYEEYVEKTKKSTRSEKRELDKEYPEYADKYFDELMGRHLKTLKREREQKELEEKFKTYEKDNSHPHFDLDNAVSEFKSALDISPDEYNGDWNEKEKKFEKLKNLKEYYNKNKDIEVKVYSVRPLEYSKIIIENNKNHNYKTMQDVIRRTSEEGIDMYVKKFEKGDRVEIPYIKFDKEGNYSGEQEGFHRTFAADRVNDKEIPIFVVQSYSGKKPQINYGRDITKDVENYYLHKNTNNNKISHQEIVLNGGEGSGNHNPGQGRGIGKPNSSPSKIIDSYKEKYSDFWLNGVGDNGFETATKKGAENYKNIVDLIEKQKDIEWNSGEYDRMTVRIANSQDEIENNFKILCKNNLTENDFYKIKNLFYDWSTNLGPRGKDGLFLDTPGIILEKDSEAFNLYKAYIQTILYESGVTSKKLFRGEPKKFDNKPKQFVSYTDSMMSAVNFARGNIENVIVEEIPINKIIAVDDMMRFSGYRTEKEWIVDSGIYK